MAYLKSFVELSESIKASNGTQLLVTAEDPKHLPEVLFKTKYSGETIVDPENILAAELKSRGLVDVAISEKGGYPHGMAQPAALVVDKKGKALVSWAIVPGVVSIHIESWEKRLIDLPTDEPWRRQRSSSTGRNLERCAVDIYGRQVEASRSLLEDGPSDGPAPEVVWLSAIG